VGIWQELVEITPMEGPMGLKQVLWTLKNRVGASGKREAESGKRVQARTKDEGQSAKEAA
jgi:hypothetical protein